MQPLHFCCIPSKDLSFLGVTDTPEDEMSDVYMVTIEVEDGSLFEDPELYDTRSEATLRGGLKALRHKDKLVTLYACSVVRVFEPDIAVT